MSTLIAIYKKSGDGGLVCVGRCDSKCYNPTNPDCECICGGANHGCGKEKAIEQTREAAERWIEEYKIRKEIKGGAAFINRDLVDQLSLF